MPLAPSLLPPIKGIIAVLTLLLQFQPTSHRTKILERTDSNLLLLLSLPNTLLILPAHSTTPPLRCPPYKYLFHSHSLPSLFHSSPLLSLLLLLLLSLLSLLPPPSYSSSFSSAGSASSSYYSSNHESSSSLSGSSSNLPSRYPSPSSPSFPPPPPLPAPPPPSPSSSCILHSPSIFFHLLSFSSFSISSISSFSISFSLLLWISLSFLYSFL
ncbi:hypothetical protein PMAYCL1PPCAC_18393 [Pristionchus mayeri]|uniref:G protein-coupled receptor n=1 Tax=Pristionchus mayeri TaxID=1317129 RepID=A0AAN5CPH6_9BILA|nr:hypothetical protein PMAYCL1PPCAC_18393 [Pristionchus mayeri]